MLTAPFPHLRLRRLKQSQWMRDLVAEYHLSVADLLLPIFVTDQQQASPIQTLPGVHRHPIADAVTMARKAKAAGIPGILLFPVIDAALKSPDGIEAVNPDNLICQTVRAIKKAVPGVGIICDVALDPYTSHAHDGLLNVTGDVDNDATLAVLFQQAVILAQAGADVVAPSDMMDGRVAAIRTALDAAGFPQVAIMSYAAKYASSFYGPFRDALANQGRLKGDKKTYQADPANRQQLLRDVAQDVAEGADMLIVKPGMPYLDMLWQVKQQFGLPTMAYQVSGEYAMLQFAAAAGALNYDQTLLESLLCFKRAGADAIITYAALEAAALISTKTSE